MLRLSSSDVDAALAGLENQGLILRGSFRAGIGGEEFCDRRILARIHRATVGRLRREIEPVAQSSFMRFLFRWQHAAAGWETAGEGGLLDVIDRLQGYETAAVAWESELLARRVSDYGPALLDRLCTGGEAVWGRLSRANDIAAVPGAGLRAAPLTRASGITFCLRESLDWLLDADPENVENLKGAGAEILEILSTRGACFQSDLIARTRRLPSDVEEALWMLAANGLVTCDSVIPLRSRIDGKQHRSRPERKRARRNGKSEPSSPRSQFGGVQPTASRRSLSQRQVSAGRWSLLESLDSPDDPLEARAMQLLHRYGVVFPELMARERMAPRWRDLARIYRRLELKGEIRGGRFVAGFVGEQFALPDAVTALRDAHRAPATGAMEMVSACDPLNLVGIVTPGERVPVPMGQSRGIPRRRSAGLAGKRHRRQPRQRRRSHHERCHGPSVRPDTITASRTAANLGLRPRLHSTGLAAARPCDAGTGTGLSFQSQLRSASVPRSQIGERVPLRNTCCAPDRQRWLK